MRVIGVYVMWVEVVGAVVSLRFCNRLEYLLWGIILYRKCLSWESCVVNLTNRNRK